MGKNTGVKFKKMGVRIRAPKLKKGKRPGAGALPEAR